MTTRHLLAPILMVAALAACGKNGAKTSRAFEVHEAWIRSAADTGATTAAYMRLHNGGDAPVAVSSFGVEGVRAVELHETVTANNMTSMEQRDSITVPAHGDYILKPGGSHIMLIGTTRPFAPGDTARITMKLSSGAIVAARANVRAP